MLASSFSTELLNWLQAKLSFASASPLLSSNWLHFLSRWRAGSVLKRPWDWAPTHTQTPMRERPQAGIGGRSHAPSYTYNTKSRPASIPACFQELPGSLIYRWLAPSELNSLQRPPCSSFCLRLRPRGHTWCYVEAEANELIITCLFHILIQLNIWCRTIYSLAKD